MVGLHKRWTPEEDDRIRAFVAQGASVVRAAAALRRKQHSVADRVYKLGCPFQTTTAARKKRLERQTTSDGVNEIGG
jgi:GcrA cell cycle regulator